MRSDHLTDLAMQPVTGTETGAAPLYNGLKRAEGLYNPANEHDACGVGMICSIRNEKSRQIVLDGLQILCNLEHRGAVGADPKAGDGAGILIQLPHQFFAEEMAKQGVTLPEPGHYGVGQLFMPHDEAQRKAIARAYETAAEQEGLSILAWRNVPVDNSVLGETVKPTEPMQRQVFIGRGASITDDDMFERKLYVARKVASNLIRREFPKAANQYYPVSCSARTIVYKGLTMADDLPRYYLDLADERVVSALALVHQRFSTNTFPSWPLAHPYRMICHNGEINTLRGNYNWMAARQATMSSPILWR